MLNIFEQPWLLLLVSILLLGAVTLFGQTFSGTDRRRLLIPLAVGLLAVGLDYFVRTDREKIQAAMNSAIKFAETNDFSDFDRIFSPDYSDRHHRSRAHLREFCQVSLAMAQIEEIATRRVQRRIEATRAFYDMSLLVRFKASGGEMAGTKSIFFVEVTIEFAKNEDGDWAIQTSELRSVNNQPFNWSGVP